MITVSDCAQDRRQTLAHHRAQQKLDKKKQEREKLRVSLLTVLQHCLESEAKQTLEFHLHLLMVVVMNGDSMSCTQIIMGLTLFMLTEAKLFFG